MLRSKGQVWPKGTAKSGAFRFGFRYSRVKRVPSTKMKVQPEPDFWRCESIVFEVPVDLSTLAFVLEVPGVSDLSTLPAQT